MASLGARQAYLDGELCGVFPDDITSFSMIQAASDNLLRQVVYEGPREDKPAEQVRRAPPSPKP